MFLYSKLYFTMQIDSTVINDHESGFSLSDTLFLNKLNENGLLHPKEEDGSSSSASGLISNPSDFNLSEGITALLQVLIQLFLLKRCISRLHPMPIWPFLSTREAELSTASLATSAR